ncbi:MULTISPECIES: hypothetical protein [Clostridium]|jgi:hypothetical protein|uniref:Cthe-2314-like HEPN domain-containing protein n=1 Tax=Clostridium lapidicellarium TaxID=3240931 RepID=A0ABV4DXB1_9CLOT|nr:hypothetical protein [uncultured Clostridium sp.]
MKYPFSKEEFLSIQDKLYDAIEDILKENIIANIDYKLVEREILYKPERNIINSRKYTANTYAWLQEIEFLKGNIIVELLLCLAYDRIYNKFPKPLSGTLKFVNRERYLKLTVYDLFTFREKLAFLIYEVFNRKIKIYVNNKIKKTKKLRNLKRNEVSFDKINKGLKIIDISNDNIFWINNDEFKLIKNIMEQFNTDEHVKIFKEIRNPFTHRSNPGIDCIPLESFEYKKPDPLTRKMLLQIDEELGIKNAKKLNYVITSAAPLEKQMKFEDIIDDLIAIWKLFIGGLESLLKNVAILKEQISEFGKIENE